MSVSEKLRVEAERRISELAARVDDSRCVACGTSERLTRVSFRWRKQIGPAEHLVRVKHTSDHPMCLQCVAELRRRRRRFWPVRYLGGISLAIALCGVVAIPLLLQFMRLSPDERRTLVPIGVGAAVLLPASLTTLWLGRRLSVPLALIGFTGRGWECVGVKAETGL